MNMTAEKQSSYHHGNLRTALLTAAEQEIGETGVESFSLRRVARRAGVSHNAPAHHFKDVQGLLTALASVGFQRLLEMQARHGAAAPPEETEQFIALGLGYIEFATSHPALFRLMFSSNLPDRNDPDLSAKMNEALDRLSQAARLAGEKRGLPDTLHLNNLIAAWVMVHGFADLVNSGLISDLLNSTGKSRTEAARDVLKRLSL